MMGQTYRVGVFTPVYATAKNNRAEQLRACIESVRQQDADFVHVLVDDGSSDSRLSSIVASAWHSRLAFLHVDNGGQSRALNLGYAWARERFTFDAMTVVHSDDSLPAGSLSKRAAAYTAGASAVTGGVLFLPSKTLAITPAHTAKEWYAESIAWGTISMHPTLWSTDAFDRLHGFDEGLRMSEDRDFVMRLAYDVMHRGETLETIDAPLYTYMINAEGVVASSRLHQDLRERLMVLQKHNMLRDPLVSARALAYGFIPRALKESIRAFLPSSRAPDTVPAPLKATKLAHTS